MTGFGTHFEVKNGVLVGDPSAVVHQTQYDIDAPVIRAWDKFSCKVDVRITDYADSTSMGPGLWFRDYDSTYQQKADGEPDAGEIWYYDYDCVSNSLILSGDYFTANNLEPVKYVLPEGTVKRSRPRSLSAGEFSPVRSSATLTIRRLSPIRMFRWISV